MVILEKKQIRKQRANRLGKKLLQLQTKNCIYIPLKFFLKNRGGKYGSLDFCPRSVRKIYR